MRPFVFPDPRDRSINSPSEIASSAQVLGNYNQAHHEKREKVTDNVKDWFKAEAGRQGWSDAAFHGNQCVLSVNLKIDK